MISIEQGVSLQYDVPGSGTLIVPIVCPILTGGAAVHDPHVPLSDNAAGLNSPVRPFKSHAETISNGTGIRYPHGYR